MRKNEKGSSLIFALAVIMIITTVIAACMAISYSYYNRSIVANSERQAYLTAKSVLTNVVENIVDKNSENHDKYLEMIPDESVTNFVNYDVNFSDKMIKIMGNVESIRVVRTKEKQDITVNGVLKNELVDKVTFSVAAKFGNQNKTLNADVVKLASVNSDTWQLSKYYEGDIVVETANQKSYRELTKIKDTFYSYVAGCSNKTSTEKKEIVNKIKTGELKEVYEHAVALAIEADEKIEDPKKRKYAFELSDTSITNDNLRKILFYGYNNGAWPEFNFDETNLKDNKPSQKYYVQVYFCANFYDRALIYANPKNEPTYNFSDCKIVFYEGHWYYNPKRGVSITNLTGNDKATLDKKFETYITGKDGGSDEENENAWLMYPDTVMIE